MIDYKNYPPNWKTEIRPAILAREGNCCKFCNVPNGAVIFRGTIEHGVETTTEVYQLANGAIYQASDSTPLFDEVGISIDIQPLSGDPDQKAIKVVLTVAHLDHDITNNNHSNLAALCQKCHLTYDKEHHKETREAKKQAAMGQLPLF